MVVSLWNGSRAPMIPKQAFVIFLMLIIVAINNEVIESIACWVTFGFRYASRLSTFREARTSRPQAR